MRIVLLINKKKQNSLSVYAGEKGKEWNLTGFIFSNAPTGVADIKPLPGETSRKTAENDGYKTIVIQNKYNALTDYIGYREKINSLIVFEG